MRRLSPLRSQRSPPRRPPPPRNRGHRSPGVPGDEPDVQIVNWGAPGSASILRPSRSERPLDRPRSRSRSRDKHSRISGEQNRRINHRNSRDSRDLSGRDLHDSRETGKDLLAGRGDLTRVLRDSMRDSRELGNSKGDKRSMHDSRGNSRDLRDYKEESRSGLRDRGNSRDHHNKGRNSSNQHLEQIKEKLNLVSKPSVSFGLQSYPQPLLGNGSKFEPPNQNCYDSGSNLITLSHSLKDDYLDPSAVGHRQNYPVIPETQAKSLNVSSRLDYKPPLSASVSQSTRKRQHDEEKLSPKMEKEDDRVARLEKLVEKLVETTASTSAQRKSIEVPHRPSDKPFNVEVMNHGELIPSSTKLTTSMWLNNLHDECLRRGFDEKTCIQYVRSKMTGIIKAWFKTVENYDFTWPELKLLITKTFPDNVDYAVTLKLLVQREKMPEETITQYFFSKMYLCEACKIAGENAVSCLIDGLSNPFMKQDIRACNFLTPEVLFSEYFSKIPDHDNRDRIERQVETYQDYAPGELILMEREQMDMERINRSMEYPREYQLDLHPRDFNPRDMQPRDVQPRGLSMHESRPKCKTCKKTGHETIDCRHAPVCYKCKEKGHIQKKCPNGFVGVLTFAMGQLRKMPCVTTCQIEGIQFFAHIDTGCTVVTIIESAVQHLGLRIINSNIKLYGYGGAETKVLGAVHTKLKVNEVEDMMLLLVVPDHTQDFPLIIGQDFLNRRNVAVFIHQGEVRVFKYDQEYGAN